MLVKLSHVTNVIKIVFPNNNGRLILAIKFILSQVTSNIVLHSDVIYLDVRHYIHMAKYLNQIL